MATFDSQFNYFLPKFNIRFLVAVAALKIFHQDFLRNSFARPSGAGQISEEKNQAENDLFLQFELGVCQTTVKTSTAHHMPHGLITFKVWIEFQPSVNVRTNNPTLHARRRSPTISIASDWTFSIFLQMSNHAHSQTEKHHFVTDLFVSYLQILAI